MRLNALAFSIAAFISVAFAATAEQWRGRSIYQYAPRIISSTRNPPPFRIIVDRYALPTGSPNTPCDTNKRTWCGGTWKSYVTFMLMFNLPQTHILRIIQNLDYIQQAGFTASTLIQAP